MKNTVQVSIPENLDNKPYVTDTLQPLREIPFTKENPRFCCIGEFSPYELLRFMATFDYINALFCIILGSFLLFKGTWLAIYGTIVVFCCFIMGLTSLSAVSQLYEEGINKEELLFYLSYRNFFGMFQLGLY